jgi:hypothetical protein
MANVLNEFLHGVSKGFQDAAFASFSRRRSTVREDINQSFSSSSDEDPGRAASVAPAQAYLDLLNADDGALGVEAPPQGKGVVDDAGDAGAPQTPPARPSRRGGNRNSGGDGLREI